VRIGYVVTNFPPVSETFVRREANALCALGHQVTIYTNRLHHEPEIMGTLHEALQVKQVSFAASITALTSAVVQDGIEHLHGSLMYHAHQACFAAAVAAQVPFSLRVYSGYDVFSRRDPNLFAEISLHSLCDGLIVEDPFMRDWIVEHLGADAGRVEMIANSLDLELYRSTEGRGSSTPTVLAIARFVEKKGLVYLIDAFNRLCAEGTEAKLKIAGTGPEENALRRAAAFNESIQFLGGISERQCREEYAASDIFCLPCVEAADGDADGVPTTVLEAMAFGLPVVTSNLLSAPNYVRDRSEGLLTAPGDTGSVHQALRELCLDAGLRATLGASGRRRVEQLCDVKANARQLEDVMVAGRRRRWQQKMDALVERRQFYTEELLRSYDDKRRETLRYLGPRGRLLDIGCGEGDICLQLDSGVEYVGCDPIPIQGYDGAFPFFVASGESLPFPDRSFDCALLYSTLANVIDVDAVLREAARVLRPGGRLLLRECVDDANPIHLNHLSRSDLQERVKKHFKILKSTPDGSATLLMEASKRASSLVSIGIPTFNREKFLSASIESVLRQTYPLVEVVVVDDGSTDGTRKVLERYRDRVRIVMLDHKGIAGAKNAALKSTSDDAAYVGILDSDDYFHPEFVERCIERLESEPDIGLVYTDDVLVDVNGRELKRRYGPEPWSIDGWLRTTNMRGDTWLARRNLVMQTELHDEKLSHDVDYDLFYQLLELTTFARVPGHLVSIRQHRGQATRNGTALAKCHAANLVKYGYSSEYAYLRARRHPEWVPAIEAGIDIGSELRDRRRKRAVDAAVQRPLSPRPLAIDGGTPVRERYLPFGVPCLGNEEIDEVTQTLRSGWIGTGPKVQQFESEFAEYVGAEQAVALNSCTSALFLSLIALGVGPGDEVITTPLTFAATVNVIEHVGAKPVFVDIDPVTLNLDPALVESAVTPQTKVLLPVHFGGLPCNLDALAVIASRHQLTLVEDAAHAIGSRYQGRMIGGHGNLTCFSFYANKNLTTAEGGMVTTNDATLADHLRILRLHGLGVDAWKRFSHPGLLKSDILLPGYKCNMTDIAASLGIHQLRKQEEFQRVRQSYAQLYDEAFASLALNFQPRPLDLERNRHSLHLYIAMIQPERWRVSRDQVLEALMAENIGAGLHYRPVHVHPWYRQRYGFKPEDLPNANVVGDRILSLPLSPSMQIQDAADVIEALRRVATEYASD
jgi:dTDP-4-amino-4,6-dideoxygalactose transaminase/glycosyltransferase involved in cell wall biosynthesis/SAM-dependent methyltransferase